MASAKLKPNADESSLQHDCYYGSIEAVPHSVISLDSNYCLINKPAHVRMSGNFNITVEKLLLHWIRGVDVKDLKWIHQLDYATSGVLCVGLNRKAAGLASCAFASRVVSKQYLAVLQGHVNINDYPLLEAAEPFVEADGAEEDIDDNHSGSSLTKRKVPTTSYPSSYSSTLSSALAPLPILTTKSKPLPPPKVDESAAAETWQAQVMEANLQLCYRAFAQWKADHADKTVAVEESNAAMDSVGDNNSNSPSSNSSNNDNTPPQQSFRAWSGDHPDQWTMAKKIVNLTYEEFQRWPKHRKTMRKFLKAVGIDVPVEESSHTSRPEMVAEKEKAKAEADNSVVTEFEVTTATVAVLRAKYLSGPALADDVNNAATATAAAENTAGGNNDSKNGVDGATAPSRCKTAPAVFRAPRDVPGGCRLVIRIPVAEIPGDFRLGVPGRI